MKKENINHQQKFSYFENLKIKQYYQCELDCPFKEEENYCFCGQRGFCELFHLKIKKICFDNEFLFKFR